MNAIKTINNIKTDVVWLMFNNKALSKGKRIQKFIVAEIQFGDRLAIFVYNSSRDILPFAVSQGNTLWPSRISWV